MRYSVARDGYRALLLDLDGTLLRRTGVIADANREAVRTAVEAGLEVWIATGRSVSETRRYYDALALETPACCYNGAVLYDGPSDRWLRHHTVPDDLLGELLDLALPRGLFFVMFHEDVKYAADPIPDAVRGFARVMRDLRIVPPAALPRRGVTKFSIAGGPEDVLAIEALIGERCAYVEKFPLSLISGLEGFDFVVLELHAPCRGKAEAVHFLEEERGIPAAQVIAIGDHRNDIPMIRAAGLGVAMGNAPDEVKGEAKLVIGHHEQDGVAAFIRALLDGGAGA